MQKNEDRLKKGKEKRGKQIEERNKKKRKKIINVDGKEIINLPIDWQKTKQKGKVIYNFNFHTEGYFFGWMWFKDSARLRHSDLWYF